MYDMRRVPQPRTAPEPAGAVSHVPRAAHRVTCLRSHLQHRGAVPGRGRNLGSQIGRHSPARGRACTHPVAPASACPRVQVVDWAPLARPVIGTPCPTALLSPNQHTLRCCLAVCRLWSRYAEPSLQKDLVRARPTRARRSSDVNRSAPMRGVQVWQRAPHDPLDSVSIGGPKSRGPYCASAVSLPGRGRSGVGVRESGAAQERAFAGARTRRSRHARATTRSTSASACNSHEPPHGELSSLQGTGGTVRIPAEAEAGRRFRRAPPRRTRYDHRIVIPSDSVWLVMVASPNVRTPAWPEPNVSVSFKDPLCSGTKLARGSADSVRNESA